MFGLFDDEVVRADLSPPQTPNRVVLVFHVEQVFELGKGKVAVQGVDFGLLVVLENIVLKQVLSDA